MLVETPIRDLKPGDIIALDDDATGMIKKIEHRSHMPSIFQDCWGRDGLSVYWENITGSNKGKPGVDRAHGDSTVHKIVE